MADVLVVEAVVAEEALRTPAAAGTPLDHSILLEAHQVAAAT
jgi:ribonuclease BN (tRNA processing enzyme)